MIMQGKASIASSFSSTLMVIPMIFLHHEKLIFSDELLRRQEKNSCYLQH